MDFIKKVINGVNVGGKLKTDDIGNTSSSSSSSSNKPCVPPKCDYISKEITKSDLLDIKNYESANYYNYFRNLEKNSASSSQIGLKSSSYSSSGSFVLEEFNIESEMTDSCVTSVWTQKYSNKYEQPVESIYQIPLAPYSTVSDFVVTLRDKVLKGKIKENSKAKEKYSDAIASGGQAFLAEKTPDGFFKLQIGNLPPNEEVTIRITIISEIGTHLESFHYCIHRFIFPNYSFNFNYKLNISLSTPIDSIELDHFTPIITYNNPSRTKATIMIFKDKCFVTKNIIAIIIPKYSDKPESFIEYSSTDSTYAVALNFYPNFGVDQDMVDQKSEFIFVLDCSGSMSGTPISQSKVALEICMRSLNENSKFNIVCFGSSFVKLFKNGSKFYNDESLEEASQYIKEIDANLGGTELYEPIVDILSQPYDPEYPRQVFILTDGEIENRDKLIEYVAKEASTTRIFTYGIGAYVDKELVIGLSSACRGYYSMILNNNDMEEQVMKLISIAMQPTFSNITVNWGGLQVVQAPSQIRPLFNQERMMIYGTLEKKPKDNVVTVNVIGNGPYSTPISFPVTLDFKNSDSTSNSIHTLSAFKRIQDLEESERKEKKDHKDLIVKLGKKYGLVSKHTSYIVTAESENVVTQETMKTVEVLEKNNNNNNNNNNRTLTPLQMPTQQIYTGALHTEQDVDYLCADLSLSEPLEEECDYQDDLKCPPPPPPSVSTACPPPPPPSMSSPCPPPPPPSMSTACPPPPPPPTLSSMIAPLAPTLCLGKQSCPSPFSSIPTISSKSSSPVVDIICTQKANGSFSRTNIPSSIKVDAAPSELSSLDDVWVTLFIIATFICKFDSQKTQWELVVQKASKFVKQQLLKSKVSTKFEDLLESAKNLIK